MIGIAWTEEKTGIGSIWGNGGTGGQPYVMTGEVMERCDDSEIIEPRLLFRLIRVRTSSEEPTLGVKIGRDANAPAVSDGRRLPRLELEGESFRGRGAWGYEGDSACLRGS